MTVMPEGTEDYREFGIVTGTVCVPFLVLIGSLNTHRGAAWWRARTKQVFAWMSELFIWLARGGPFSRIRNGSDDADNADDVLPHTKSFESSASAIRPGLAPAATMSEAMMSRRQRRLSSAAGKPRRLSGGAYDQRNAPRRESRAFDKVVEPSPRGEGPAETTNGAMLKPPTISVAPTTPTSPPEPPSALASMWQNERRTRLRYSEDV